MIGVGYERPDGALEHLACDALILACNGFGGNPAMVRELLPEMGDALFAGHTGNDGSGGGPVPQAYKGRVGFIAD